MAGQPHRYNQASRLVMEKRTSGGAGGTKAGPQIVMQDGPVLVANRWMGDAEYRRNLQLTVARFAKSMPPGMPADQAHVGVETVRHETGILGYKVFHHFLGMKNYPAMSSTHGQLFSTTDAAALAHDMWLLEGAGAADFTPQDARELGLNFDLGVHDNALIRRLLLGTDASKAFMCYVSGQADPAAAAGNGKGGKRRRSPSPEREAKRPVPAARKAPAAAAPSVPKVIAVEPAREQPAQNGTQLQSDGQISPPRMESPEDSE